MARNISTNQSIKKIIPNSIEDVITKFYEANTIKLENDKKVKAYGEQIKNYFSENNLEVFKAGDVTAKVSMIEKISFDDEKLMQSVKKLPQEYQARLINTVETINEEALERLIVSKELNYDLFKEAEIKKITPRLLVKKLKSETE